MIGEDSAPGSRGTVRSVTAFTYRPGMSPRAAGRRSIRPQHVNHTSRTKSYRVPVLEPGALGSSISEAILRIGEDPEQYRVRKDQVLSDGTEHSTDISFSDLWPICDVGDGLSFRPARGFSPSVHLWRADDEVHITVKATIAEQVPALFEHLESGLGLSAAEPSNPPARSARVEPGTIETLRPATPDEVTLRWLADNVPLRLWLAGAGALVSVFIIGVLAGQTSFAKELVRGLGIWE